MWRRKRALRQPTDGWYRLTRRHGKVWCRRRTVRVAYSSVAGAVRRVRTRDGRELRVSSTAAQVLCWSTLIERRTGGRKRRLPVRGAARDRWRSHRRVRLVHLEVCERSASVPCIALRRRIYCSSLCRRYCRRTAMAGGIQGSCPVRVSQTRSNSSIRASSYLISVAVVD